MKVGCYECEPATSEDYSMYNETIITFITKMSMDEDIVCIALSGASANGYAGIMKAHCLKYNTVKPYNEELRKILLDSYPHNFNDEYDNFMVNECRRGVVPIYTNNLIIIQKGQIYKGLGAEVWLV